MIGDLGQESLRPEDVSQKSGFSLPLRWVALALGMARTVDFSVVNENSAAPPDIQNPGASRHDRRETHALASEKHTRPRTSRLAVSKLPSSKAWCLRGADLQSHGHRRAGASARRPQRFGESLRRLDAGRYRTERLCSRKAQTGTKGVDQRELWKLCSAFGGDQALIGRGGHLEQTKPTPRGRCCVPSSVRLPAFGKLARPGWVPISFRRRRKPPRAAIFRSDSRGLKPKIVTLAQARAERRRRKRNGGNDRQRAWAAIPQYNRPRGRPLPLHERCRE